MDPCLSLSAINCCQGSLTSVLGWVFPAHSIEFRVCSSYFLRPN